MRQAGAEAAQKANQKKVVQAGSLRSDAPTSPEVATPSSAPDLTLNKASEEPHTLTETTAVKTPAVLAAEGAKRTSVDKIAEPESSTDAKGEPAKSTEESMLEARRTSSITKNKTPLSTEMALESTPSLLSEPQQHVNEKPRTHQGSSVFDATPEEITSLEKSTAIPEEEEEEEDEDEEEKDQGRDSAPGVPTSGAHALGEAKGRRGC